MKQMKSVFYFLVLFVLLISFALPVAGSNEKPGREEKKKFRKSMRLIDKGQFRHAEANLLELWKADSNNLEYNYELALLYFYDLKKSEQAHRFFLKVKDIVGNPDDYPELHYYLGQTYHFNEEFENAIDEYSQCNEYELEIKDEIAGKIDKEIAACKYAMTLTKRPDVKIRNLSSRVNTWFAEYVPVPVMNDSMLLFTSIRPPVISTNYGFEGPVYFEKIYISRRSGKKYGFAEPSGNFVEFNGLNVKRRKHNAVVGMNYDGNLLLLYRKNKVWTSEFKDGKWQKPKLIQKSVNFSFYQPHVSMTKDGNTVYFSSWSKNGFGNLDIYKSEKNDNGRWGQAINLGFEINTAYNEDSPEISPDGKTLYFSSQGHKGIGGFDIYKSEFINGSWTKPENMGMPINSPGDDIFFRFSKDKRIAYFSSYRKDGLGNMDIYEAEFSYLFEKSNDPESQAAASAFVGFDIADTLNPSVPLVIKPQNRQPDKYHFNDCHWKIDTMLFYYTGQVDYTFLKTGTYNLQLELNVVQNETKETETFCISKPVVIMTQEQILAQNTARHSVDSTVVPTDTTQVIASVNTTEIKDTTQTIAAVNTTEIKDTTQTIASANTTNNIPNVINNTNVANTAIPALQNIYFDFDKSFVNTAASKTLDGNIEILKANSGLKITITAHTDNQGSSQYNKLLSERRAKAVYDYIVSKDIDKTRIIQVAGKGEEALPAATSDAPANTISYHKISRRCEIALTK